MTTPYTRHLALHKDEQGLCKWTVVYVTESGVYVHPSPAEDDSQGDRLTYIGPSAIRGWGDLDGDASELQLEGFPEWSILLPTPVATPELCRRAARACAAVVRCGDDWDAEEAAHARWATRLLDPADGQLWSFEFSTWGVSEGIWIVRAQHLETKGSA